MQQGVETNDKATKKRVNNGEEKLVREKGHMAQSVEIKELRRGQRMRVANSKLKDYVWWDIRMERI